MIFKYLIHPSVMHCSNNKPRCMLNPGGGEVQARNEAQVPVLIADPCLLNQTAKGKRGSPALASFSLSLDDWTGSGKVLALCHCSPDNHTGLLYPEESDTELLSASLLTQSRAVRL